VIESHRKQFTRTFVNVFEIMSVTYAFGQDST